jgi:hypothetical protein
MMSSTNTAKRLVGESKRRDGILGIKSYKSLLTHKSHASSAATTGILPSPYNISRRIIIRSLSAAVVVSVLGFAAAAKAGGATDNTSPKANNAAVQLDTTSQSSGTDQNSGTSQDQSASSKSTTVNASTSSDGNGTSSVKVTVNGQDVPVSQNGTTTGTNGDTTYTVTNSQSSTGSATSSSVTSASTNVTPYVPTPIPPVTPVENGNMGSQYGSPF